MTKLVCVCSVFIQHVISLHFFWFLQETLPSLHVILAVLSACPIMPWHWAAGVVTWPSGWLERPVLPALVITHQFPLPMSPVPALATGSSSRARPLPQPSLCCLCVQGGKVLTHHQGLSLSLTLSLLCLKVTHGNSFFPTNQVPALCFYLFIYCTRKIIFIRGAFRFLLKENRKIIALQHVVLVSAIQQWESAISIHEYPPCWASLPSAIPPL